MLRLIGIVLLMVSTLVHLPSAWSQENPYIVAYDHNLEEPGSLEVEYFSTFGTQRRGPDFHAYWAELEYGATAWWTTELYLDGQTTFGESTLFTGYRWENRFRPLQNEHLINPVLYVEFENTNGADKILKEVEGHDVEADYAVPNAVARQERAREMEFKLILSSNYKGWNFTENTIATKNLSNEPWEFGYAMGASRPLAMKGAAHRCNFCRQHFVVGVELYGGLGDRYSFGLKDTSHYLGAGLAWNLPSGWTFRFEPTFGLNDNSHQFLLRWGVSREFSGFGSMVGGLFKGRQE
ncbi:MAG TPA: hypothetical protein VN830_01925 [Verrucomicrobiae bacterium]|nr:hypothetical protein [Verrucomicrobiae bacterium]